MLARLLRTALFIVVGVLFLAHWVIADPGFEESASQSDWRYVLLFSAAISSLAFALPVYGRFVGGRVVFRLALVAGAGAALGSLANIVEDGLQKDWAFFAFVLGSAIILIGVSALTVAIAVAARGSLRLLALVPAGTLAALMLYVVAGGPIMLATWLAAAALTLALPTRPVVATVPTSP